MTIREAIKECKSRMLSQVRVGAAVEAQTLLNQINDVAQAGYNMDDSFEQSLAKIRLRSRSEG